MFNQFIKEGGIQEVTAETSTSGLVLPTGIKKNYLQIPFQCNYFLTHTVNSSPAVKFESSGSTDKGAHDSSNDESNEDDNWSLVITVNLS